MISPKKVAEEVKEIMDKGFAPVYAFQKVAHKYNVRVEDVRIASSVRIEKLWAQWCPNRRRV